MAHDHPALYPNVPDTVYADDYYVSLKPAEKAFVDAYLSNLGTSAKAAGKSIVDAVGAFPNIDNSERATRMLQQMNIRRAIHQRARAIAAKFEISAHTVLKEVANIATANMANYLHITPNGDPYIHLGSCTFDQLAAIQEVTVEEYKDGRGEDARDVRKIKLKLHPKLDALDKLMRYLQLYAPERLDINVNVNSQSVNVNMTPEQAAELYQSKLRQVG